MQSPPILYGTAWKKERTEHLVRLALATGFRGVDTACQPKHYDEAGVGRGVAASGLGRAELYLQTKFTPVDGQDPRRIPYDPALPIAEQVRESFRASQTNLQTDYVDCLVLHSPFASAADTSEAWQALEQICAAGGALRIGISNCYDARYLETLHRTARVKPAVVQNRFHAATGYDREIRRFCRANGISYQSFWTLTANAHLLGDPLLERLSERYARTPAQILFRFLTQQGVVPLTGTTSAVHMQEDLAVFDFALESGELDAIDALLG